MPKESVVQTCTEDYGGPNYSCQVSKSNVSPIPLAVGRESLERLLADPRVALAVLSEDDVALTAYRTARVIDECIIDSVVAVEIAVERVQDHRRDTFVIEAGVRWRWTDSAAQQRDSEVRMALARLAQR